MFGRRGFPNLSPRFPDRPFLVRCRCPGTPREFTSVHDVRMSEGPKEAGDDRALVRAAQKGDQRAFRALVERYQRRVVQLALGMTKDPDEAMDIAQETFVKVHRCLPSFKGDSSFFTWTYRIAMNLCLDAQRRKSRAEREDLAEGDEAEIEAAMDPPSGALSGPQRQTRNAEPRGHIEKALQ